MSSRTDNSVDLISELRLRQWARRNYVAPQYRRATWHPIVLSEMAYRDQECLDNSQGWTHQRTPFVPLAPTDITYLDEAHPGTPAPAGLLSTRDYIAAEFGIDDEEEERIAGF